ncbi:hypothetical protein HK405_009039 [Cladochytrium tenue]|nr:hypothetical protein HK405_009039 [Cladochytrium tenue]
MISLRLSLGVCHQTTSSRFESSYQARKPTQLATIRVLPPNILSSADTTAKATTPVADPFRPDALPRQLDRWRHPEFIINERQINIVIAAPAHGSPLELHVAAAPDSAVPVTVVVPVKGYAYFGGGRRVTRVDVLAPCVMHSGGSGGGTGLAPRHGSWFLFRSWDAAQNTQPREMTWNLLAMMSNSWYRVQLERDDRSGSLYWVRPTNIA